MDSQRPSTPDFRGLKRAYARKENIMSLLRREGGDQGNDQTAILLAYDLQAGSYVANFASETHRQNIDRESEEIAAILDGLKPVSLLEAGIGEATGLVPTVSFLKSGTCRSFAGFDLSWSRLAVARRHWQAHRPEPLALFSAEMESIPLADDSVDVVLTIQAIEPNRSREAVIMHELYRIARRYVVLIEPIYELAGAEARARMDSHGYCRGLKQVALEAGWNLVQHRLLDFAPNPLNPPGVLVIEKAGGQGVETPWQLACPFCREPLISHDGHYFCQADGLVFPVLRGVPMLSRANAIVASHFLE